MSDGAGAGNERKDEYKASRFFFFHAQKFIDIDPHIDPHIDL